MYSFYKYIWEIFGELILYEILCQLTSHTLLDEMRILLDLDLHPI